MRLIAGMLAIAMVAGSAWAESEEQAPIGTRWELWGAAISYPALSDLEPEAGGAFNSTGFGIGLSAHWPVGEFDGSTLLVGVEGAFTSTSSDIPVYLDELYADDVYVALSTKWLLGEQRRFALDAGLAYHFMDITQRENNYYYYDYEEFQSWEESALGGFVGVTWDTWAGTPGRNGGLALALKVHFVDFGTVQDDDIFVEPVLGPNAGDLDGPFYLLQVGYSSR